MNKDSFLQEQSENKSLLLQEKTNIPEYTVKQISDQIRKALEGRFDYIRVRGEVSELMLAKSGHLYMTLRDAKQEAATIKVTCWRSRVARLAFMPERGQDVTVTGRVTAYTGSSQYQLDMQAIELTGVGVLLQRYEALKKRLQQEGYFDREKKRTCPQVPRRIGIITSPQGAVIRDILHRAADRFPCHIQIWPAKVQGEGCVEEVIAGIKGFNDAPHPPDVLIIARGGGSFQDLWGFNDERMIMAAASSKIPIVSAIGHETDTPLLDFVADVRAPTPTAAAEYVLPVYADLVEGLGQKKLRMRQMLRYRLEKEQSILERSQNKLIQVHSALQNLQQRLDLCALRLVQLCAQRIQFFRSLLQRATLLAPRQAWQMQKKHLEGMKDRLLRAIDHILSLRRQDCQATKGLSLRVQKDITLRQSQLASLGRQLRHLSHESQLQRGYSLLFNHKGAIVRASGDVHLNESVCVQLADQEKIYAKVTRITKSGDTLL